MNKQYSWMWIAGASVLALAIGFGLARWTQAPPAASAAQAGATAGHGDDAQAGGEESVVRLTPGQIQAAGIEVVAVGRGGGHETRLSGRVESVMGARAAVAATVGGRVERVLVATGAKVRQGAPLAVLVSGEAATLRASADAAAAEAEAARQVLRRDRSLERQGVVARQELEASRARSMAADAAARAARAQVAAAGMPDAAGRVTVGSPVEGVVGSVQITPGGVVSAGDRIATVSDPTRTELVFSAPPTLASQVHPGMRIDVSGATGSFSATVVGVAADVGERGGVAVIRARAEPGALPPAGSAVTAGVVATDEAGRLSVPADAVQNVEGRAVVFVAIEGGFRAVPVLPGRQAGGRIEILDGLAGHERIAGGNAFLLKAELAKGDAGHGH